MAPRPTSLLLGGGGRRPCDGLVLVDDMMLDDFGVDLGVLEGDHAALTVSSRLSNGTSARRRAFTRAVWRVLYEKP